MRGTPVEDISVTVLTDLGRVVHRQAEALKDLLAIAISEATTAEQITKLERVSAEAALRVEALEHDRTEQELLHLERLRHQTLSRVRQLEEQGHTHADQKAQLEADTERAQRHITTLEVAQLRDLAQLAELEKEEGAATNRVAELEAAAVTHREVLSG